VEFPHAWPSGALASAGQMALLPEQVSCGSQDPVEARQTVPEFAKAQVEVQQSSLLGSQTALVWNLQVVGSQQGLFPQPATPPQSQSSPCSTIPFPHCEPVMVRTFLLDVRQPVLTELRPMAEQIFPMLQGLKFVIPGAVDGFITKRPPAGQVDEESGQHCCAATVVPSLHVELVQSCTAPNVCPTSCAMTSHSVFVLTMTLAPDTVSFELPVDAED
jgi:hypothetical protein